MVSFSARGPLVSVCLAVGAVAGSDNQIGFVKAPESPSRGEGVGSFLDVRH
jgi:hypothetical protein